MAARPWIVPDELWELIEPLLPAPPRRLRYPGRKRLPDRPSWAAARASPAGDAATGPSPVDRGRAGSGHHLLDAMPAVRGRVGAPRRHPRGVPRPGLLHDLLPTIGGVIVKRVLGVGEPRREDSRPSMAYTAMSRSRPPAAGFRAVTGATDVHDDSPTRCSV